MINIIGKDDSLLKKVTCQNCASILEYPPAVIEERHLTDYTGSRSTTRYITCPCCKKQILLNNYAEKH